MGATTRLVVFRLDDHRYALPLAVVDRIVRAVAVTPLPDAPAIVAGIINVHGRVVPVLNVRRRFLLPEREIGPADWFLLARVSERTVALVIDESEGLLDRPDAGVASALDVQSARETFPGVIGLDDGLVLIHDLEKFLTSDEVRALDRAVHEHPGD